MSRKKILGIIIAAVAVVLILMAGWWCWPRDTELNVKDDTVVLQIQLDLKEDIGLLIINYKTDHADSSGGVSNANKSLLKHDELLDFSWSKQELNNSLDGEDLELGFTIVTEYIDPNYENIYPAEYTIPLEPITVKLQYGKNYQIKISGDRANGYKATLVE